MTLAHIETIEIGSGQEGDIEFLNIPQDGSDLKILISGKSSNSGSADVYIRTNGTTASRLRMTAQGTSLTSTTGNPHFRIGTQGGVRWGNTEIYISNYTDSTSKKKIIYNAADGLTAFLVAGALVTNHTTAIDRVAIGFSADFAQYSKISLYKIVA